jgi:hypothetical protein
MSHSIGVYTHTSICSYEYTHVHSIPLNTSKRLDRLDFKIYKVSQKNVSLSTGTSSTTKRIISRKYTTLTLNLEFNHNELVPPQGY